MSSKWIPYPFYWDDVPVDISFVFENEKPAGKHGFLTVKGKDFVFEDGTEARFWGTNFNGGLNFPPPEFSEKLAKRLGKIGVNLVRLHQMDAEWATPNIFQFTKGKRKGHTLDFDSESMKRLDYLLYCLKQEGIYIYMDLLAYRKFKTGDGIENAKDLTFGAKPYANYSRALIDLQKKFNADLWEHVNPHTGLAYKDDPSIALTCITNESDLFRSTLGVSAGSDHKTILDMFSVEPYRSELLDKYRAWCKDNDKPFPEGDISFSDRTPTMTEFLMEVQEEYYREMMDHLRGIGVRVPIAGTNWLVNAANTKTQLVTDFADNHVYWYAWSWSESCRKFDNRPMVAERNSVLDHLASCRFMDRPFFVSEWDDPWPNEWRAESPLFVAAAGLLQDWAGFAIHTYCYSTSTDVDVTGKEVSSTAIGGVPYREGVFNTWNDPAKFGLFYHAALMYRRRDVQPANKSVEIKIDDLEMEGTIPALSLICEQKKVGVLFEGQKSTADEVVSPNTELVNAAAGEIRSDTGELYRNWIKRFGWIDTDRTKVAYGFVGEAGTISLKGLKLKVKTDFATVAISSLTDSPITCSDNMLLTAVGRSENTDMKFNEDHTELLDIGKPPILIEAIQAEIRLNTEVEGLKVWAVNAEGFFAGEIPTTHEDGVLCFNIGETFPSLYYLIQAE